MHRHHALLLTLTALASGPTAAALAGPGTLNVPPDSFINQHVDSVPQLTEQVTMDPVVRRRLARHFHTSGPAIVQYIQKNLELKRVTVARRYQVYCLASDGHEYVINARLPVGTPVFVLRGTDKPVLKLACGNPMMANLPSVVPSINQLSTPKLAGLPTNGTDTLTPSLKPNGPVVLTMVPSPDVPVTTAISPFFGTGGLPIHGGGGGGLGYLAGLPILYGILHHGGGNGNSTNSNNSTSTGSTGTNSGTTGTSTGTGTGNNNLGTTNNNTNNTGTSTGTSTGTGTGTGTGVTPVPEPSTPAAFLIGGAGLALLLAGTKRRSRRVKN